MTKKLKIYTASHIDQAPRWKWLAREWPEFEWTARWPWKHAGQFPDSGAFAKLFWEHDLEDVTRADVVLCYAAPDAKPLRGALIEAGAALGLGRRVLVIGTHPSYGTWQFHPGVTRAENWNEARELLRLMACRVPEADLQPEQKLTLTNPPITAARDLDPYWDAVLSRTDRSPGREACEAVLFAQWTPNELAAIQQAADRRRQCP